MVIDKPGCLEIFLLESFQIFFDLPLSRELTRVGYTSEKSAYRSKHDNFLIGL